MGPPLFKNPSCVLSCFICVRLFVTTWTVARQAPLSMGFSRQESWSGLLCPSPGDLPNPGIKPVSLTSPALAGGFFTTSPTWENLKNPSPDSIKCWIKLSLLPGPSCLSSRVLGLPPHSHHSTKSTTFSVAVELCTCCVPSLHLKSQPSTFTLHSTHFVHTLGFNLNVPSSGKSCLTTLPLGSASPSLKRLSALCS